MDEDDRIEDRGRHAHHLRHFFVEVGRLVREGYLFALIGDGLERALECLVLPLLWLLGEGEGAGTDGGALVGRREAQLDLALDLCVEGEGTEAMLRITLEARPAANSTREGCRCMRYVPRRCLER